MASEAIDATNIEAFSQAIYTNSVTSDNAGEELAGYYLMGSDVGLTEDDYIFRALTDFDQPDLSKWDIEEWIKVEGKVTRRFMPFSVWVIEVAGACGHSFDKKSARTVARRVIQISYDEEIKRLTQSNID